VVCVACVQCMLQRVPVQVQIQNFVTAEVENVFFQCVNWVIVPTVWFLSHVIGKLILDTVLK